MTPCPCARRSSVIWRSTRKAASSGARSVIWLPMWQANPTGVTWGEFDERAYSAIASSTGTPNLSPAPPVVILAWPPAPILGFTRMAMAGAAFLIAATAINRSSSVEDSTLI